MKVSLLSVTVNNQDKALAFYTEKLGFIKKTEVPLGEHKWLTVVSAEEPDGPEVVLEPLGFEPAKIFQKALYDAGIPAAAFTVTDVEAEHQRLTEAGVTFSLPPTQMGTVKLAVLDDTCGNRIQLLEIL
ncbi:VOC family protein [Mucilaginibacter lacusdianchii]|uniref:VOC family protein n=1 Tax=Mucilaginibacter lacusdianchii TaxID=2684211 RepID=UPI0018EEF6BE|nr:VOC family protein [Mucilaginibacter sp. JXJ CY 39]